MNTPILLMVVVLIVIAIAFSAIGGARAKSRGGSLDKPWPLEVTPRLLSDRERALCQRLVETLPDHIILAQVHLRQVLEFKRGSRSHSIVNSFDELSRDFLILNPDTSIVAAVELDDSTHARENRRTDGGPMRERATRSNRPACP